MKNKFYYYLIAFLSTAFSLLLQWRDPAILSEFVEGKTYDLRLKLRESFHDHKPSNDIIIVTIDEQSIKDIGRWPWSRSVMAKVVDNISGDSPKAIGLDILFSEPENSVSDSLFADSLKKAGNVVIAAAFPASSRLSTKKQSSEPPPDFLWDAAFMQVKGMEGLDWKKWVVTGEKVIPPLKEFAAVATMGHVTTIPDLDGTLRWDILSVRYGDDYYPSFPLQIARIAAAIPAEKVVFYGGSSIGFGDKIIRTDLSSRVLVNYVGEEGSYHFVSASDVVNKKLPKGYFNGKIVLVGTSALGTFDQKISPLSGNMPGVEKNATVVQNILENSFIEKSPGVIEIATILSTGLILALVLPRLTASIGVTFGFVLILSYSAVACWLLIYRDIWISGVLPVGNMMLIMTVETISKLFAEEQQARQIKQMFSSYVSPKIVNELIENPELAKLGGHRREVTILFSDIIGFTTISEKLAPEDVVKLLNEYYKEMAEIIFHWDGTLDKFVGDEIMAVWSAPIEQPDHAERAVRCAINMSDKLDQLQQEWVKRGIDVIDCGIGINTGEALIGNIGLEGKKMDYTVIGNHVNIAARVEKLTREHKSRILVTDATMSKIPQGTIGHICFEQKGEVLVKGKNEPVAIIAISELESEA